MKNAIFATFCVISYSCWSAALVEDELSYRNMTFDTVLRGSWNLDKCAMDMINCWEIVKGDVICSYGVYYSSMCSAQREHCDTSGWLGVVESLYESYCIQDDVKSRRRGRGRGRGAK